MTMNKIEKLIKQILNKDVDTKIVTHILDVIERDPRKNEYALTARKNIRLRLELAEKKLSADYPIWLELIKRTYQIRAYDKFDDYLLFLEWDRQPEKQFYLPRRAVLKKIVDEMQDLEDGKFEILSVSLPPRTGKFLKNSTPILTKNGWKNHGDLVIGDEVLNHKGEFVKVQHIFPKSSGDIRVWFTDGTYLDTHENHEWLVFDRHQQKERILETKDMIGKLENDLVGRGHRYFYMLPKVEPIKGEQKELHVDPYTMGAWLGDGTTTSPIISGDKNDYAILDKIETKYKRMSQWVHKTTGVLTTSYENLRANLQKYGMCHSRETVEKFIPQEYLTASLEQRLQLLAGLIDTDGSLKRKERRYQFTTSGEKLRDDFVSLVSTFGWRASVVEYEPRLSSSGIQGKSKYWSVSFNPTLEIPCQLERKQLKEFSEQRRIAISKIEKRAPEEGNCIQVEGGIYLAGKTLKPTHNSTLGVFFITWTMGRNPDKANVMSGHSDKLTDGFFREALNVISDADTYNWAKVFPNNRVERVNAKDEIIDLNNFKRFPTLTCRSVEGTLTGAVEVGNILYCDDLVSDLEEALNPSRLQSKWEAYVNQLKDRKKLGAKEIHVATRWSVADPIGRIKELYANDPRYREIIIPALDENEKSNFNYPFEVGFDEEYYYDMRKTTDAATWSAKYLGQPYEREGLLFPADDLKYFNGTLPPEKSLVKIFAFCDVAWGGGDYVSMPIAYEYEDGAIYIPDVVFTNGDRNVSQPIVAGKLKHHRPSETEFEANNGGQEYAYNIDDMLKADGINLNINHRNKPATKSKLSRIIEESPNIREVYFLDQKNRTPEYEAFMQNLTSFVQTGKVKNDDAPDSMSGLMKMRKTVSREIKIFNRF